MAVRGRALKFQQTVIAANRRSRAGGGGGRQSEPLKGMLEPTPIRTTQALPTCALPQLHDTISTRLLFMLFMTLLYKFVMQLLVAYGHCLHVSPCLF
jgi:hypothetical protein